MNSTVVSKISSGLSCHFLFCGGLAGCELSEWAEVMSE